MLPALVGLVLGYLVSIPPTGAVALLVVRRALQRENKRAFLLAIGTAFADVPYVWLGATGYGYLLARHPVASSSFDFLAATVLGYLGGQILASPVEELPPPRSHEKYG